MFTRLREWLIEKLSGGADHKMQEAKRQLDRYLADNKAYRDALEALDAAYQSEIDSLNVRYKGVAKNAIESFRAAIGQELAEKFMGGYIRAESIGSQLSATVIRGHIIHN